MTLPIAHPSVVREVPERTALGGRYVLRETLGHGGMSTVYAALDLKTSARVAVKIFRPGVELAGSPGRRQREAQLAAAVQHPGVLAVLDAQLDDPERGTGCAFLVTELVDGPSLSERLRSGPLAERDMVGLAAALCGALAAIHSVGIIHRDIKPANVLLPSGADGLNHPKLADFGIALMVDSTRMTATGFLAGTPTYLSPEQVQGQVLTPASDIYSLGLLLIEAVLGTPVFRGSGLEAAVARLHADPVPPRHLDPRLARLLTRMTARVPADRPSAIAAAAEFDRLRGASLASEIFALDALAETTRPLPVGAAATRKRRVRVGLPLGVAGLVAAVAVALTVANERSGVAPATAPLIGTTTTSATQPAAVSSPASSPAPSATASSSVAVPAAAPAVTASAGPSAGPAAAQPTTVIAAKTTSGGPPPATVKTKPSKAHGNGH